MKKDNEKRSYLRSRGFTYQRFQKWAAIKVFYNQCQLFEHMKLHNLCSIDVSDIMLMPLPADLSYNDWTPELEIACEALMEYTFLLRVHVMDWLRLNKIENNWWKLINDNDDNSISEVVRGYRGRQMFKTLGRSEDDQDSNSDALSNVNKNSLVMEFIDTTFKDKDKNNHSAVADKNVSENEDNPCMSTDIAFVDCGPTIPKCFEPEPPISCVPRKQMSVLKKSKLNSHSTDRIAKTNCKRRKTTHRDLSPIEADTTLKYITTVKVDEKSLSENTVTKQSSKSPSQQHRTMQSFVKKTTGNSISKPIIETDIATILDNPVKIDVPFSAKNFNSKTNSDHLEHSLRTSIGTCPKVLTIQSLKKADVTSIITDLSPQLTSNKKVVVLEQNPQKYTSLCEKDVIMNRKKWVNKSVNNSTDTTNTLLQKKQVTGKYLIKAGKRYLIKDSESINTENSSNLPTTTSVSKDVKQMIPEQNISTLMSINSGEAENVEQATSPHNDISFLTPSPSPSELSSGSSCESHAKQTLKAKLRKIPPRLISLDEKNSQEVISLVQQEHGEDIRMSIKIIDRVPKDVSHDVSRECEMPKYRMKMIEEFRHMGRSQLMERIDHLKHIGKEMWKAMNFVGNNVIVEKLKPINVLQQILKECIRKCGDKIQDNKNNDVILGEWESKETDSQRRCPSCRKPTKPDSYIAGFSKLSKNDDTYCYCYKYVCHECRSYHGTLSRFVAHQNFHTKKEPYICPDCHYSFVNAKFLEIHMWTDCLHMLKKRIFACKICNIDGFKDIESITIHFVVMHSVTKIACELCCLVFVSYDDYMKHYTTIHTDIPDPKPIRLVMCKLNNRILRYENFMSYLETNPAIQELTWYKCPFCTLVAQEDKHVTLIFSAHLRDKHSKRLHEVISKEALTEQIFNLKFRKPGIPVGVLNKCLSRQCEDGTVIPKIVNTRTISSEIFERGSHDTDSTCPINSDAPSTFAADVSSQIVQKVDTLPKILDVRSMANLKATVPSNVAATLTELKLEYDPQASQSDVIQTDGDLLCKDAKEMATKPGDVQSDIKKETEELEQPGKSNDESITLCAAEPKRSPQANDVCTISSSESSKEISHSEPISKTSTNGRIKVVDIRKICKPNIEPFIDEPCDTQSDNESAASMLLPKPPPLARIPQHILDYRETEEKMYKRKNAGRLKFLSRRAVKMRRRIAIVGPTDTQEGCVEFLCHICNERINTSGPVVRTHFAKNHSREYQLATLGLHLKKLPSDFLSHYNKFLSSKKRKSDVTLSAAKRKRRWTPKKHTEVKDTGALEVGLCVKEETAEDGEGNFKCKKCGQRCTDMSSLREHIATNHRLKGRYLICLECGENFVVAPSLQMHLKAFHGIEDPTSYMSQNPSYALDANNDLEAEGRTTVANQCYVCMAVFEDKAAVDKHLRVHGMAFLNRKRIEARNALKSPEKKPNTEENKQSPVAERPKDTVRRDKSLETILEKLSVSS